MYLHIWLQSKQMKEMPDGGALDRAAVHAFLTYTAELAEATNERVESMKAILRARGIQ
jgi:uncharacterized hydantoinase/oxoprolinase family protein